MCNTRGFTRGRSHLRFVKALHSLIKRECYPHQSTLCSDVKYYIKYYKDVALIIQHTTLPVHLNSFSVICYTSEVNNNHASKAVFIKALTKRECYVPLVTENCTPSILSLN